MTCMDRPCMAITSFFTARASGVFTALGLASGLLLFSYH